MQQNEIYQAVTDQIIKQIEEGTPPWRQPWMTKNACLPTNASTGLSYRGTNIWLLILTAQAKRYESNLWATFNQWKRLGGYVNRGSKAVKLLYWKVVKKTVEDKHGREREEERYYANTFSVFNLDQCGGDELDHLHQQSLPQKDFDDFEPAERLIEETGADIRFGGSRAYYSPADDYIRLPETSAFDSEADYYSTALHELAHWTGHESRLNRSDKLARFGTETYAMEELVAEMASAFLCTSLGIENTSASSLPASYLNEWLGVLKSDSRAIITASSAGAAASDYLLSFSQESVEETTDELVAV